MDRVHAQVTLNLEPEEDGDELVPGYVNAVGPDALEEKRLPHRFAGRAEMVDDRCLNPVQALVAHVPIVARRPPRGGRMLELMGLR